MCTVQVQFLHDQQAQVLAVVEGTADVAFVRADQPSVLAAANVISLDQVKILSPVSCRSHCCRVLSFACLAWDPASLLHWLGHNFWASSCFQFLAVPSQALVLSGTLAALFVSCKMTPTSYPSPQGYHA